ncbi:MAG: hypothetical protein VW337_02490, partial [Gammaproteobacteria bacterium]
SVPEEKISDQFSKMYMIFIGVEFLFVMTVIFVLLEDFGTFIAWVTSMGFVVAPIFSFLNHKAMFGPQVDAAHRPSELLRYWSISTIIILSIVGLMFVYMTYLM